MPEGDSYTRAADRIRPILVGRAVMAVEGSAPDLRKRSGSMVGVEVTGVRTVGKHLLIDLANELTVHVHLGMPGRVSVTPDTRRSQIDAGAVRLAMTSEAGTVWVLAAPTVQVDRRAVVDHGLKRLGPDVLADEFDWERFELQASRFPGKRTVAEFLLDQRVMAGVGNVYKCEVLFLEGVVPTRTVATIDVAKRTGLAQRARRLMLPNAHRAMRTTTGRPDGGTWVFERTGKPCRRCRTAVIAGWIGEPPRITYWCPSCQT